MGMKQLLQEFDNLPKKEQNKIIREFKQEPAPNLPQAPLSAKVEMLQAKFHSYTFH